MKCELSLELQQVREEPDEVSREEIRDQTEILNIFFQRQPKVPEWKFDLLKVDLSDLQRAALKRIYSRREHFYEVAVALGVSGRELHHLLATAKRKLKKLRKRLKTLQAQMPPPKKDRVYRTLRVCHRCGDDLRQLSYGKYCASCNWDELDDPICAAAGDYDYRSKYKVVRDV